MRSGAEEGDPGEFVADCAIETDLELLLPADYVAQPGERIALYKELDKIERDSELKEFEAHSRGRL